MPTTLSVAEGSALLVVCAEMMPTPVSAILAKNVVVTLATEGGTGMYYYSGIGDLACVNATACSNQ